MIYGKKSGWALTDKLSEEEINNFIDNSIKKNLLKINEYQKEDLLKKIKKFPLHKRIKNKFNEIIIFKPRKGQNPLNYILHFLTKYSEKNKCNIYSVGYSDTISSIENTIKNPDERILGEEKNQARIYYIKKKIITEKIENNIVVVTDPAKGITRCWTHFNAKQSYINKLAAKEKKLIEENGVFTRKKIYLTNDYVKYNHYKRITPLYLGERGVGRLQSTQVTQTLRYKICITVLKVKNIPHLSKTN